MHSTAMLATTRVGSTPPVGSRAPGSPSGRLGRVNVGALSVWMSSGLQLASSLGVHLDQCEAPDIGLLGRLSSNQRRPPMSNALSQIVLAVAAASTLLIVWYQGRKGQGQSRSESWPDRRLPRTARARRN